MRAEQVLARAEEARATIAVVYTRDYNRSSPIGQPAMSNFADIPPSNHAKVFEKSIYLLSLLAQLGFTQCENVAPA